MVVTEELIQKQKAETQTIDGVYTVVVKGAGVVNEEKPILEALLPGVRLRFLRYGMFLKKGERRGHTMRIHDDTDEKFTLSDADASNGELRTTDHFMVGTTLVREGYIYLINPDDDTDCHELKVNLDGTMNHIIWDGDNFYPHNKEPKDKRTPQNDSFDYKRIVNKEKNTIRSFWIGYSPVQWSHKHFEGVLNMSDDERKALHMVFVKAGGIKKGEETAQEHVLPYHKVAFVYHEKGPIENKFRTQLKQISATERNESRRGKNEILEDMFITLHDPIGAVEDIAIELEHAYDRQETIVEAIQNGEQYDAVFKRKKNGQTKSTFSKEEEQLQYLFQNALTTYHLVYGDSKMESDYSGGETGYWTSDFKGSGVDKVKVEHVLGVAYRKKERKYIRKIRDELGSLMHTEYYTDTWKHYQTSVDDYILDGKFKATTHMALLAKKPHGIDRHLDLKKNYEDKDDTWEEFFSNTLDFSDDKPLNKLLDTPIELFFLSSTTTDLANKMGGVIRNLAESYADKIITSDIVTETKIEKVTKTKTITKTEKVAGYKDVFFKRLQKFEMGGETIIEVPTKTIEAEANALWQDLDTKRMTFQGYKPQKRTLDKDFKDRSPKTQWRIDPNNNIIITRIQLSKEVVLKEQLRGSNYVQLPVIRHKTTQEIVEYIEEVEKEFSKVVDRELYKRKYGELVEKLFNSKIFTGSLALLQVFNVLNAASTLGKEKDLKNVVNTIGITTELIEASYHFKRSIAISKKASEYTIAKLYSKSQIYGNVGAGITVLMCAWEAFDSANARDYDAMWAWSGAGAAWGAFSFGATTASWSTITGLSIRFASLGFTPWGIAIGGIAIGLTALAYYLTDTPLEAYFKNNILSDAVASPQGTIGTDPWAYALKLYQDRDNQIPEPSNSKFWAKDAFKKWEDMTVAYQDFLDILVCAHILFTPIELIHKKSIRPYTSRVSVTIDISDIVSYRAEISFRQFLTTPDQLEFEVYYFKDHSDNNREPLHLKKQDITIDKTKGQIPKAIIDFTVYQKNLAHNNDSSHIVFVCRLALEKNSYFPIDIHGKDRYIGATFTTLEEVRNIQEGLFSKKTIKDSEFQGPVAIDTLDNLLSKKAWNTKFRRRIANG